MLSIKKLVVIVLVPLMFGAFILAGLQQIKSNELAFWQENARQDINQEARHIVIGQTPEGEEISQRKSKEQFRDLVIYSQISAVNCQLLYWIHGSVESGQDEIGGQRVSEYVSGYTWPNKIAQNSEKKIKYSIPGRLDSNWNRPFNYLERSNFVPTCTGTGNAISHHIVDKRSQALREGDLVGIAFQFTVGTLLGGLEDLWNMANCKQEPGWLSNRGNDMEGRYGRIGFSTEKTIFPGRDSGSRVWAAQFLNYIGNCPANNEEFVGPEFYEANEWNDYLPYPDDGAGSPQDLNYGVNGNSPPFNEHQSAESDTIIDAPILTDEDIDDDVDGSEYGDNGGNGWGDFPRRKVWYVICEGASGYVQTNANTIWNSGEAVWGKNNKIVGEYKGFESRTFTFVHIEENKTACLENKAYTGDNIDYHGDLGTTDHSCDSLSDVRSDKVEYYGQEYECIIRRYRWNHDDGTGGSGDLLTHIWEIGWRDT